MRSAYLKKAYTPSVLREQAVVYGEARTPPAFDDSVMGLGDSERQFIGERDSFYMATVSEEGWPYVQHRGGAAGFLKVIGSHRLAFIDRTGNRQLISRGNLNTNDRVALFLMNYAARERLKVMGRARFVGGEDADWLSEEERAGLVLKKDERWCVIEVEGFDWNCPKHITARFTREEVERVVDPLRKRIAELEARLGRAWRVAAWLLGSAARCWNHFRNAIVNRV